MNVDECTAFEILISADLDGELDEIESVELQRHLTTCSYCRDWHATCRQLAVAVASVATDRLSSDRSLFTATFNGREQPALSAENSSPAPKPHGQSRNPSHGSGRWFLTIAALLLVGIGLSFAFFSRHRAGLGTLNVEPVAAMHAINLQTEQDQQATLRAVEMELRAMKLEVNRLQLEPADRAQIENRLDSLLTKARQLDASTQILYQGEKP